MSFFLSEELTEKINIDSLAENNFKSNASLIYEDICVDLSFLVFKKDENNSIFSFLTDDEVALRFLFIEKQFKLLFSNQCFLLCNKNIKSIKKNKSGKLKIAIAAYDK